jgi:hypothetical protein
MLADFVAVLHLAFVLFVVLGGLLVLKWPRIVWVHLPAAAWGAIVEFTGWLCPLTPLEYWLRKEGGQIGYSSDFVSHYILPLLYPSGLTHNVQIVLGMVVVIVNVAVYGWLWRRVSHRSRCTSPSS